MTRLTHKSESPAYYAGMDLEEQEAFTKIYNRILDEINTWDFYNKNLCIAYLLRFIIRQVSKRIRYRSVLVFITQLEYIERLYKISSKKM